MPPQERSVGMVFQNFGLFPHMTVRENLAFAIPKGEDPKQIDTLLEQIDLIALQHQKPARLSGGQRQRVALARALARQPRLLLLDEPFSAQDAALRRRLQAYLLQVHRERRLTTVLVTHHLPDVLRLADEALILDEGRAMHQGSPEVLFPGGIEA
jgi:molybdate transport system ATP-binding protein